MGKITVRDYLYKKNMTAVAAVVFIFSLIFLIFINSEMIRIGKDEVLHHREFYRNIINSKIRNLDYYIETLKNNTEMKVFLERDIVMVQNTEPVKLSDYEYYMKYTQRKINKYIFAEKLKKTVKWDDSMEFEVYSLKKELVFSTSKTTLGLGNFSEIDINNNFGNLYEYLVVDGRVYIRVFAKLNENYLLIVNYYITSDFIYDLFRNGLKTGFVDANNNGVIFYKDIKSEEIKVLFSPMKNMRISLLKGNPVIIFEEPLLDFKGNIVGKTLIIENAEIALRLIFANIVSLIIIGAFIGMMYRILTKHYEFSISLVENIRKIMAGEKEVIRVTNIKEYDEITEMVADFRKLKEEQEKVIMKEIESKNHQIDTIMEKSENQSRFLKKIVEKDDIRTILEISFAEFSKITKINELIFSMSMEGEKTTKVLKVSEHGMIEDDKTYNINDISLVSKMKKEETMEIESEDEGILVLFFASDSIKNGFITINYDFESIESKNEIKSQLIKLAKLMIAGMKSAKYYEMSIKDSLTGAYVKGILKHNIETNINTARRYKKNFALLMCDIDFFKQVNDTFGHLAGDYVLRKTADVIKASIRESDMFFRYGGEEFVILMPESDRESAEKAAERIREGVEKLIIFNQKYMEIPVHVTISIGGYVFDYNDSTSDYFDIIENADNSLYAAKKNGRNRVVF